MQDSLNIIQDATISEDSIEHYGVMGMKWGHRKQYAQSHNMTSRQLRKQIKADNKEAFRLGREATIADRTSAIAEYKLQKAINKSKKNPKSNKRLLKTARASFTATLAKEYSEKARAAMKAHRESLVKKYGDTKVSQIKYNKHGQTNERVTTTKDWAINAGLSALGTLAGSAMLKPAGMRMFYVSIPGGKEAYAKQRYKNLKKEAKEVVKLQSN